MRRLGVGGPFNSTQGPGASFQELLGQGVRGLGAPVSLCFPSTEWKK